MIRELAHTYARADRAQVCWTLGITEHHNAADNVFAIINLSLLTGHVGRFGSGLVPLRGQNNVQGGGDMGAIPNKFVGGQDVENAGDRATFERDYGRTLPPERGMHLSQMFEAMEHGKLRTLYVIGENPMQSEADGTRTRRLLEGLDHIVVQDIFLTKTAEIADVVLPASASWCESEGTVTSSERRVQRVRKALNPPGDARDDIEILCDLARRLGHDWGTPTAEDVWNELRRLSPWHGGMSYARLEALDGLQWPCPDERAPGQPAAARSAVEGSDRAARARRSCRWSSNRPVDTLSRRVPDAAHDGAPARVVQHRRADGRLHVAAAIGETLDLRPRTARDWAWPRASRAHRLAARRSEGARAIRSRPAPGPRVHDDALSRRGRDEHPDDRRDGSEVRHGGVQGVGDSGGKNREWTST